MEYTKYNGTDLLNGLLQAIKNNSFEEYQNSIVSDLANLELDVIDAVKGTSIRNIYLLIYAEE